jgi:hypothetical protein
MTDYLKKVNIMSNPNVFNSRKGILLINHNNKDKYLLLRKKKKIYSRSIQWTFIRYGKYIFIKISNDKIKNG